MTCVLQSLATVMTGTSPIRTTQDANLEFTGHKLHVIESLDGY